MASSLVEKAFFAIDEAQALITVLRVAVGSGDRDSIGSDRVWAVLGVVAHVLDRAHDLLDRNLIQGGDDASVK